VFRLEKVLRWKEGLEREARVRRLESERRVTHAEEEMVRTRARRESAPDEGAGIDELARWSRYLESLRRAEARLQSRIDELRLVLEARIREHVELRRDVKGLERLAEKDEARTRRRREKQAQEHLDDAASRTHLPHPGKIGRVDESDRVERTREGAAP
jgi:flagellar export protein FliJ